MVEKISYDFFQPIKTFYYGYKTFYSLLRNNLFSKAANEQYLLNMYSHSVSLLGNLEEFCTRIFHIIYKFQSIWQKMIYSAGIFGEIFDPFFSFPGFLVEFWCVLQENSASWQNCSAIKILVKAIKRTKNTSWEVFFNLI